MEIGERIRELRSEKGLTQQELADRSELSKGFISQLENDNTSPSIATLEDILIALGTKLSDFFAEESEEQVVFHSEDDYFEKVDEELSNVIEWVVPNAQKNGMEPIRLTLAAGGSTTPDMPHEGEEFGYVLKGCVMIHLGNRTYRAKAGESFYYRAEKKHHLTSEKGARLIWVSTPPTF